MFQGVDTLDIERWPKRRLRMVRCDECGWKRLWPVLMISGSKCRITLFRMLKEITGKKERKKESEI